MDFDKSLKDYTYDSNDNLLSAKFVNIDRTIPNNTLSRTLKILGNGLYPFKLVFKKLKIIQVPMV